MKKILISTFAGASALALAACGAEAPADEVNEVPAAAVIEETPVAAEDANDPATAEEADGEQPELDGNSNPIGPR